MSFLLGNSNCQPNADDLLIIFNGDRVLGIAEQRTWAPVDALTIGTHGVDTAHFHYLGDLYGKRCFALEAEHLGREAGSLFPTSLFAVLSECDSGTFAAVSRGKQILAWYRDHRFCGRCAAPCLPVDGERAMACSQCNFQAYPRISPCVIVLVHRGDEVLLGRGPQFPQGMFSTLAGFIEAGESAEEALIREIFEETAIEIGNLRYLSSQSWPFPGQLMLGFFAEYQGGEIQVDGVEIEEAYWFDRRQLPKIPPPGSISRHLIDTFLQY